MKLRVVKNGYFVTSNVEGTGLLDQETFENSFVHFLVVGDVWDWIGDKQSGGVIFKCVEGKWEGQYSEGWWEFDEDTIEGYFEILTED